MRILLTTHQFLPQFSAGTEVLTLSVARELLRRGHVVRILTAHPGGAGLGDEDRFDEYDFEGIHVYRFHHAYEPMGGQASLLEVGYDNQLAATYFEHILKAFEPHLAHFFHLDRLGTGLIERAAQCGIPRFMTPTDFWAICPMGQLLVGDGRLCSGPSPHAGNCLKHFTGSTQQGLIGRAAELLPTALADVLMQFTASGALPAYPKRVEVAALARRLSANVSRLNKLNGLIVPNGFMTQLLVQHGVNRDLITVSGYGIDLITPEVNEQRSGGQRPLRIGFIGTLAQHKGCHILIEAFKKLPAAHAILKIYGQPGAFPGYMQKLKSLAGGHPSIEFCGTFPNSNIAQIFRGIDVLVVPSVWYENTPLVLYSSRAARCPVVASNLPGLAEVIQDNEDGLLFEAGNSSDLAQQLSRLISDEGLLKRLSACACTPKSTEQYVDELLAIWQEYE